MSTNDEPKPDSKNLPLGHDHAPVPVNKYWDGSLHIPIILGGLAAIIALLSSIWDAR
ncbi:MAG: hypothetical protein HY791_28485 [Deltaproteobacteria bacterium]|nr:hypothetical protein [Deltaproteobacteria bacterium]